MKPKDFRKLADRECPNVRDASLMIGALGQMINATGRICIMRVRYDLGVHVFLEQRVQEPSVLVVGDATPVVALAYQVQQCLELHVFVLVQEHLQLHQTDAQVGLVELVRDIPAQRPEISSLLHHPVEEAKGEQQATPFYQLFACLIL